MKRWRRAGICSPGPRPHWLEDPPAGLNALARRLDQPGLHRLLGELDRACYAGGDWHGEELADALPALPGAAGPSAGQKSDLAALYP